MPQIQLDSARPGIRGAETVSVGEKAVDNGILAPLGDTLKRLPQLYVNTDLHTRMEKLADTLDDNAALEAELAFDRWNAQALYGSKDNQTATAYADFEKEKDPTLRAMQLNGLLHARGMAAADGGKMYDAASQAVMNEMLGGMRPEARVKVALRLKAKREDTLRRLNERGFAQAEAAQTARQKELVRQFAAGQGEETAREVSEAEAIYAAAVRKANTDYATAVNSLPTEAQFVNGIGGYDAFFGKWHGKPVMEGDKPDYKAFKADYEAKAASSRDGQIAAAEAAKAWAYAAIGTAYATRRSQTDELVRASILNELGLTEEQAASPEWAPIVEGKIAAAQQENGAAFLESMLGNGHVDFVEAALGDEAALASDYGIRDRRIVEGLQLKIAKARNDGVKANDAYKARVSYELAQCDTINPNTGEYLVTDDVLAQREKQYEAAGDFDTARLYREKINKRMVVYNNDRVLFTQNVQKELQKKQEALLSAQKAASHYTPEDLKPLLTTIWTDDGINYLSVDTGKTDAQGKRVYDTFSKFAFIKWAVENQMGLDTQKEKDAMLKKITGSLRDRRAALAVQKVITRGMDTGFGKYDGDELGGHIGFHWSATDEDGNLTGPLFYMRGTDDDRKNVTITDDGTLVWNTDQFQGALLVRKSDNAYTVLSDKEIKHYIGTLQTVVEEYAAMNPEGTPAELEKYAYDAACHLFGGWNRLGEIGHSITEREATLLGEGPYAFRGGSNLIGYTRNDRVALEAELDALAPHVKFFEVRPPAPATNEKGEPNHPVDTAGIPIVIPDNAATAMADLNRANEEAAKAKAEEEAKKQPKTETK